MTIGFDGSRAFDREKTGTENYSHHLLKALAKIDRKNEYIVYIRLTDSRSEVDPRRSLSRTRLRDGDDGYKWPDNFQLRTINWSRLWTQGGLAIQTFKENLDVLFISAHTSPLIHKPGLKTVVTVHDLGVEYLPKLHQLKQRLYLKWITNFQLKNATRLIAVSYATKMDLIKKVGCDPKKIEVIYEGYDRENFKSDRLVYRLKQFGLVPGGYFLFVGTVQPRKNLVRLIQAYYKFYKYYNSYTLVLAGSKGWLSDEIYKLPQKLGIEDKVKFLGYVADENLPALYGGAIALLFPSLYEGFGLPILEAQACGCPVLTSQVSSMPEVAGKAAVYVNPSSIEDIIRGMKRIMNKELRIKLIKQGFENIRRFSWEKCARETLKVLEGL